MFAFSAGSGLLGLALSSFVSATLLPGASEVVLLAVLQQHPEYFWSALGIATTANTLGSLTSYVIGRMVPNRVDPADVERVRRYGYPILFFAWVPVIGDALPLAAGWLRFEPWRSALVLVLGKFARYLAVAGGWTWFAG